MPAIPYRISFLILQQFPQHLTGPCQPGTDVAFSDADNLRDLGITHVFQNQCDHLPVCNRQTVNRLQQTCLLLLLRQGFFRILPRVGELYPFVRSGCRPALRDMRDGSIVRNAKDECALGALPAEIRKGVPNRESNVLQEIVAVAGVVCIACCQSAERSFIRGKELMKTLFESCSRSITSENGVVPP